MAIETKLVGAFPTGEPGTFLGVVVLRLEEGFAIDVRVFKKGESGLSATERGMAFPVSNAKELAEAILRACGVAQLWALVATDAVPADKPRSPKSPRRRKNGVVVPFPNVEAPRRGIDLTPDQGA